MLVAPAALSLAHLPPNVMLCRHGDTPLDAVQLSYYLASLLTLGDDVKVPA